MRIADVGVLTEAWGAVLAADAEDDVLSRGVARFAERADEELDDLVEELRSGEYRPGWLTEVVIPKPNGGERILRIPRVRDRVVERALMVSLVPLIDPLLGPSAFGYRPGLGVRHAVHTVAALREEGHTWVLRTDVDDCFPSVRLDLLRRLLHGLIQDSRILAVLDLLLARPARRVIGGGLMEPRGLPQGSPLSPLLSNLVLESVDERIRRAGFPLVRYGDDLCVLVRSRDEGWDAARVVTLALEEIGMRSGADKTEVISFEEGFSFLGEDFGFRYPPAIEPRVDVPRRRTMYLGAQGSWARIGDGRIIVMRDDDELLDVPAGLVERIVCFGSVGVSSGLRNWALSSGVDMVYCSHRGRYLGQTVSGGGTRPERLRRQFACADDPEMTIRVAKGMIEGKLRKQAVILRRMMRRESARELGAAASEIDRYVAMLAEANTGAELMGLEGAAARSYFQSWTAVLDESLGFSGRNRRPPLDVVNSALSFGYAVLVSEATSALVASGLDPSIGLLHTSQGDRPSLSLDLAEEFRPWVVDQVVMEAVSRRRLTVDHGRRDDARGGVLLTRAGREVVLDMYEQRMLRTTKGALPDFSGSIRRHLYRQAQVIAACVDGTMETYTGLSWR